MIISDFNYLEPVSEQKKIVGGLSTATSTNNTFSLAHASAIPSGNSIFGIGGALSEATGTENSAFTLTNTFTSNGFSTYGSVHALAGAVASTDNNFESSYSNAHSTYVGTSFGYKIRDYGSSLSF